MNYDFVSAPVGGILNQFARFYSQGIGTRSVGYVRRGLFSYSYYWITIINIISSSVIIIVVAEVRPLLRGRPQEEHVRVQVESRTIKVCVIRFIWGSDYSYTNSDFRKMHFAAPLRNDARGNTLCLFDFGQLYWGDYNVLQHLPYMSAYCDKEHAIGALHAVMQCSVV